MNSALGKVVAALALVAVALGPAACPASGTGQPSPTARTAFTQNVQRSSLDGSSVSLFTCEPAKTAAGEFPVRSSAVPLGLAMADFTGDSNPDLVTVKLDRLDSLSAHYLIEIQLTEGGRQSLGLTGPPGGLFVTPKDVTGDGTLDLVVRVVGSQAPVAVFLNDGCGHFAAGEPAPSYRIQNPRSGSELTSATPCRPAPAVGSGSYTIECQLASRRSAEQRRGPLAPRTNRVSSQLFLQHCSNRAPPTVS
jgi:hypothetical protein